MSGRAGGKSYRGRSFCSVLINEASLIAPRAAAETFSHCSFKVCLIKWTSFQMWHKQIHIVRSWVKEMKRTDLGTLLLRAQILFFAYCPTAVFILEGEDSCWSCSCMGWPRDGRLINCHYNEFWTFTLVCAELTVLISHKPCRQFDFWIRVAMVLCVWCGATHIISPGGMSLLLLLFSCLLSLYLAF